MSALDSDKPIFVRRRQITQQIQQTQQTQQEPSDKKSPSPLKMAGSHQKQNQASQLDVLVQQLPNVAARRRLVVDLKIVEQDPDFKIVVKYLKEACWFQNSNEMTMVAIWMWINDFRSLFQVSPTSRPNAFVDLAKPTQAETRRRVLEAIQQANDYEIKRKNAQATRDYIKQLSRSIESVISSHEYTIIHPNKRVLKYLREDEDSDFDSGEHK